MTSPHDDVPQGSTWASPTGPAPQPPAAPPVAQPGWGAPAAPPPPGSTPPPPPPGWGGPPPGAWGPAGPPPPGGPWRPPALQPGIIPLRPIGPGEIYDGAFRAIRANPKVMFGMSAIVVTIAVALQSLVSWYAASLLTGQFDDWASTLDPTGQAGLSDSLNAGVGQFVGLPITSLATTILTGLLIVSVSRSVLGQVVTVGDVLRSPRVWLVVGFSLLFGIALAVIAGVLAGVVTLIAVAGQVALAIGLGLLALLGYVVVYVWLGVRTGLATPALMLEGKRFWSTIGRAWRLSRGSFWRLFGIYLLTVILAGVIGEIFTVPAQLFSQFFLGDTAGTSFAAILINGVADIVALTLSTTFVAAVTALLYIDVRMRREGLDVELARAAEQTA